MSLVTHQKGVGEDDRHAELTQGGHRCCGVLAGEGWCVSVCRGQVVVDGEEKKVVEEGREAEHVCGSRQAT